MHQERYMLHALGIELLNQSKGSITASMTVNQNNCQIAGLLCGGASVAMAEILSGMASMALIDEGCFPLGIQVSANHVRSAALGQKVFAKVSAIHIGKSIHLWNTDITDEQDELISTIRVTNKISRTHK